MALGAFERRRSASKTDRLALLRSWVAHGQFRQCKSQRSMEDISRSRGVHRLNWETRLLVEHALCAMHPDHALLAQCDHGVLRASI